MTDNITTRKTLSLGGIKKPVDSNSLLEKSIKNSNKQAVQKANDHLIDNVEDSRLHLIKNHEKNKDNKNNADFFDIVKQNIPVIDPILNINEDSDLKHKKAALPGVVAPDINKPLSKQNFVRETFDNKNKKKKHKSTAKIGEAADIKKQVITKYVVEHVEEITEDEYNVAEYEKLYGRPLIIKSSVSDNNPPPRKRKKESFNPGYRKKIQEKLEMDVEIDGVMLVREFSEVINVKVGELIKKLMKMGIMLTANQNIDPDTAELIAMEYGHNVSRVKSDKYVDILAPRYSNSISHARPPIVTIMGHVDHGKTSLLDAIRNSDIATDEHGGITQHIGAYGVTTKKGDRITFIDTPGHEAFSDMRSRGARITDIIVLVVAADDGIMPQTVEAINHAKRANVPIIVAINKIDKPGANVNKIRESLMQYDLLPEEYGGTVMTVPVSAATKENLDKLLDSIILQAEVMELTALSTKLADGTIIESKVDKQRGVITTILVQNGVLKQGDVIVSGIISGKIRMMFDDRGQQIKEADPSTPVEIFGFEAGGLVGDTVYVMESEKEARALIEIKKNELAEIEKVKEQSKISEVVTAENAFAKMTTQNKQKNLYFIIKADTQGSLEAVKKVVERIQHEEFIIKIISNSVGAITDSDITSAKTDTGSAAILAFNVKVDNKIVRLAQIHKVKILDYSVIYHLEEAVKAMASELLTPNKKEEHMGSALVKQLFDMTKFGKIAGCTVTNGVIKNGALIRIIRKENIVYKGTISSLRHLKDEVKEVISGRDCGIKLANYEDMEINDRIEVFYIVEEKRFLD